MTDIRALVAGNWKMNGNHAALEEITKICSYLAGDNPIGCDAMICPPVTLIASAAQLAADTALMIGGQDCQSRDCGAHTGDISAAMLHDCGAVAVIVGHSERRSDHGEGDALVRAKAAAALAAGLTAIVCVGETEGQRRLGLTLDIVGRQVVRSLPDGATAENVVVAYEPVWAIGTGLVPSVSDVAEVHGFVRGKLESAMAGGAGTRTRILYGGSVKPQNAAELMAVANVNGALVGGASLKADDFIGILSAYQLAT